MLTESGNQFDLTAVDDALFFDGYDSSHGGELWRSDGTIAGTRMVKDIRPGPGGSYSDSSYPNELTDVHGTLFFAANDGAHRRELWRSDGTRSGTRMVRDIKPGARDSYPNDLTAVHRHVYFAADDGRHGRYELWRSDGTRAGTTLVKDIWPGFRGSKPGDLTAVGGTLYFAARDAKHGRELWRTVKKAKHS